MFRMSGCYKVSCIVAEHIFITIHEVKILRNICIEQFWLRKIVPITDAILRFEPLVMGFLACFECLAIDGVGFAGLLEPFFAESEEEVAHCGVLLYVVVAGGEGGDKPFVRPFIPISLDVAAAKNRSTS